MKKIVSMALALAMLLSVVPMLNVAFAEEVTVSAVRAMYFNNGSELKATDGDNILIASNGSEGWQCATSFTDEDGTLTNQASLSGTGFASPRNAVVAFTLPDIDYDKLIKAEFSITVKNVKQVTSGERIAVYANSLKDSWSVSTGSRDALGYNGPQSLGLEMLGFTTAIKTGNQTGESESNETITMSSKKLVSYLKQLKADGYTEVTFRLANSLGGIRFYDANQSQKPTLTLETGEAVDVSVKTTLADGSSFGVADKVVSGVPANKAYSYGTPESILNLDGKYYIYNAAKSTLTITPTVGGDNVISLVYDKFEGTGVTGDVISEEGATCWFADPRSLTVKNDADGKNVTYVGYIDNHGSVKAAQYDNNTGKMNEVLVRSNFQPDDHNNPTFLELPDHRIMIFYSRHTDEACFYYRISKQPYDITTLGDEKHLATTNNTTYPNPFILSDDPDHIYLGWRGIGWHPTLGRLTMPDENDNVVLELEKQIVQSTGARPYAKYTSNGKDEIWVTYTTGHPDNEDPNWLYFNRVNINTLDVMDVKGNVLSNVNSGTLAVNKTSDASRAFAVDTPSGGTRDWVWEIVNDNNKPVIAMVKISGNKQSHDYWYASYNGNAWQLTDLPDDPATNTFFHQTPGTENCYSGGMTIDKANPHEVYVSMPVNGVFGKVFEIVKFTLNDDYTAVINTEYITQNSAKNNVRPYIANGSEEGDFRLTWMNGDYYFWINDTRWGGKGFPTRMMTLTDIAEPEVVNTLGDVNETIYPTNGDSKALAAPANGAFTISMELLQSDLNVGGTLLKSGNLEIVLEKQTVDPYNYAAVAPKLTAGGKTQKSDNLFSNSDWFSWTVNGTGGDKGVNNMGWINYTVTYDGKDVVTYVNGLIDATLQNVDVTLDETMEIGGMKGLITNVRTADVALTQAEVKAAEKDFDPDSVKTVNTVELEDITDVTADIILPATAYNGSAIAWTSDNTGVVKNNGAVVRDGEAHTVTLTATVDGESKAFTVTVAPKADVKENLVFKYDFSETYVDENGVTRVKDVSGNGLDAELYGTAANLEDGKLDLTANTADGWTTNGYMNVPYDFLKGVRSYTVIQQVKNGSATGARLYDFGYEAFHSMFTRANALAVGIKDDSNGGTKLVAASAALDSSKEQWIVTSYDAATGITTMTVDGVQVVSSSDIPHEPYKITNGTTRRNFIGRTQWNDTWDQGAGNQDFNGIIDNFMFFNAALTEEEIKELTSASVTAQSALSVKADGKLGLAFTAKVSGNLDLVTEVGFEYGKNGADENVNYVVEPVYTEKKCEAAADEFRLIISGISNANSARTYVARPYVVVGGQKVYGEAVSASLYGSIVDSIVNGKGTSIRPERLAAANSVIAFVKANKNDKSEAKFPLLKAAYDKLYNADGTIVEKAASLGVSDDAAAVSAGEEFGLEAVEIEFVEEKTDECEIVTDLTVDLDFAQVM